MIFLVAVVVIILPQCARNSKKPAGQNDKAHSLSVAFNNLSRENQVQECAKCHRQEYENELKGPHANSYKVIIKHKEYIHKPAYECSFYAKYVDKEEKHSCIGCHASDNIYQTYYTAYLTNPDSIIQERMAGHTPLPQGRSEKQGYITGVDCITCHYNGESVVTSASFVATKGTTTPPYCSPSGSKFFSKDYNCLNCHLSGMAANHSLYDNYSPGKATCVSCHQEYDVQGKGTHYYYWRYDPAEKHRPETLLSFYEPTKAIYAPGKVVAYWQNTSMPHLMGEADEFVLDFKVIDKKGRSWGSKKLRFNCKDFHDKAMMKPFDGNVLPGTAGIRPLYDHAPITIDIPILANTPKGEVSLQCEVFSKAQYWLNDSIGVLQKSTNTAIR